jgi:acyl-[acyl-carrier-protein]-phospholipid O-acyltransferase/long-chain-fatty-acid--[acyl-carrier-protein] ligase
VSLSAIEQIASELWPNHPSAATTIPSERRGEEIVLVTERPEAELGELQRFARQRGLSEIMLPKRLLTIGHLPLLGSGKPDYPAIARLALPPLQSAPELNDATP